MVVTSNHFQLSHSHVTWICHVNQDCCKTVHKLNTFFIITILREILKNYQHIQHSKFCDNNFKVIFNADILFL